jgi:hypothetical protein
MWSALNHLLDRKPSFKPAPPSAPRLILTEACVLALCECLNPEIRRGHEGIAYLVGRSDSIATLAIAAMRPDAQTTEGGFYVGTAAMAQIVRAAATRALQVVGQVHTHPRQAFHSGGDEEGAKIAYSGYVSLVLPDYGRHLPAFDQAALFMFRNGAFVEINPSDFSIIPGQLT